MYDTIINRLSFFDGVDILEPIIERHFRGRVALVSSFGAESAVLLHMASTIDPSVPVIFLETGKLFWETIAYRSKLIDRLGLTDIRTVKPDREDIGREDPDGTLHKHDPDRCCRIRKSLPLEKALHGFDAWISGRKRFHGGARSALPTLEMVDGRLKVEPLARFTARDIDEYMNHYDLPRHPLVAEGYRSIGCMPCTVKGGTSDNPRAGRWAGLSKTECGIHWSANGRPIRVAQRGQRNLS
jgi:phosphoadenosine phosphosulfate reductase